MVLVNVCERGEGLSYFHNIEVWINVMQDKSARKCISLNGFSSHPYKNDSECVFIWVVLYFWLSSDNLAIVPSMPKHQRYSGPYTI